MTPTQRTLAMLRERGWQVAPVERWIPGAAIRKDAFGWIDLLALDPVARQIWGVQSTGTDFAGHRQKLLGEARAAMTLWLHCGGKALLVGWRKLKTRRGSSAFTYEPRIEEFTIPLEEGNSNEMEEMFR